MTMFSRILVCTDFGEPSDRALQLAVDMTREFRAELVVLHVCEVPAYAYMGMSGPPVDLLSPVAEFAQKELDDLLASLRGRTPQVRGVLKLGVPWERILTTVSEVAADLVIMGTHGRRGAAHALLGSVAERIVRTSPVPVLTVRSAPPTTSTLGGAAMP